MIGDFYKVVPTMGIQEDYLKVDRETNTVYCSGKIRFKKEDSYIFGSNKELKAEKINGVGVALRFEISTETQWEELQVLQDLLYSKGFVEQAKLLSEALDEFPLWIKREENAPSLKPWWSQRWVTFQGPWDFQNVYHFQDPSDRSTLGTIFPVYLGIEDRPRDAHYRYEYSPDYKWRATLGGKNLGDFDTVREAKGTVRNEWKKSQGEE